MRTRVNPGAGPHIATTHGLSPRGPTVTSMAIITHIGSTQVVLKQKRSTQVIISNVGDQCLCKDSVEQHAPPPVPC